VLTGNVKVVTMALVGAGAYSAVKVVGDFKATGFLKDAIIAVLREKAVSSESGGGGGGGGGDGGGGSGGGGGAVAGEVLLRAVDERMGRLEQVVLQSSAALAHRGRDTVMISGGGDGGRSWLSVGVTVVGIGAGACAVMALWQGKYVTKATFEKAVKQVSSLLKATTPLLGCNSVAGVLTAAVDLLLLPPPPQR